MQYVAMLPHRIEVYRRYFFLRKLLIYRYFIKGYFRDDIYQIIDRWTMLARIFRRQYTRIVFTHTRNTCRLCIIRYYNKKLCVFWSISKYRLSGTNFNRR